MRSRIVIAAWLACFILSGSTQASAQTPTTDNPILKLTLIQSAQTTIGPVVRCVIAMLPQYGRWAWRGPCKGQAATGDGIIEWYEVTVSADDGQYHYLHYRDEIVDSRQGRTMKDGVMVPVPEVLDRKARVTAECLTEKTATLFRTRVDADRDLALHDWTVVNYFARKYRPGPAQCGSDPGIEFVLTVDGQKVVDSYDGRNLWLEEYARKANVAAQAAVKSLDEQVMSLKRNAKRDEFRANHQVQRWTNGEQLSSPSSTYDGQIVGLFAQYLGMSGFDKGEFLDVTTDRVFVVSKLADVPFEINDYVVIAGTKMGTALSRNANGIGRSVPHLEYVHGSRCAATRCKDYLE